MKLHEGGVYLVNGTELIPEGPEAAAQISAKTGAAVSKEEAAKNTIAYGEKFPIPYVLTNCHNSLCAVGGTINEDDHMFGLTCAKKYGGVYVPPHQAVIHQFAREMLAGGGKMILGSDSTWNNGNGRGRTGVSKTAFKPDL